MKKLKLDLDRIQVESFNVEVAEPSRGTVNAFSGSEPCESYWPIYCRPKDISHETAC